MVRLMDKKRKKMKRGKQKKSRLTAQSYVNKALEGTDFDALMDLIAPQQPAEKVRKRRSPQRTSPTQNLSDLDGLVEYPQKVDIVHNPLLVEVQMNKDTFKRKKPA